MDELEKLEYKKLNYFNFYNEVEKFFQSEYEKTNLYPLENDVDEVDMIFIEEISEVVAEVENIQYIYETERDDFFSDYFLSKLKNTALKAMFECLQVVSLCDKYKEGN